MTVHTTGAGFTARCSPLCGWRQWFTHRADAQRADEEHRRRCGWVG